LVKNLALLAVKVYEFGVLIERANDTEVQAEVLASSKLDRPKIMYLVVGSLVKRALLSVPVVERRD
jgi:hypothetical protein